MQLQSAAEMNRILLERGASDQAKKMPMKKRKKVRCQLLSISKLTLDLGADS